MKTDIIVIGGGASGLMAAYSAASSFTDAGVAAGVTVLEKMPRPARKVMITGKGRCNFTNVKDWDSFSRHIRSKPNFVRSSFHALTPDKLTAFFRSFGMESVVERGDRAFPASYRSSDVVDTLVSACNSVGVRIECGSEVREVEAAGTRSDGMFRLLMAGGGECLCRRLIIATGGLSYPGTGSTGDGYRWASGLGHRLVPTFPSLTALVPAGYKHNDGSGDLHIDRSTELSDLGKLLCGIQLKNVGLSLEVEGKVTDSEFGDVDFTDGGIEGPLGFQLSRKAVKSMTNGSRVALVLDLKSGVPLPEFTARVQSLWKEVDSDPRSVRLKVREKSRVLLGKLMPRDLVQAFEYMHPEIYTLEQRGYRDSKLWVNLPSLAKAMKQWRFDIAGYVGYERAVVTAGGVNCDDCVPKTMESRIDKGLYFCGEILDLDADTGGYNLHLAFCTGSMAGRSAALSLIHDIYGTCKDTSGQSGH